MEKEILLYTTAFMQQLSIIIRNNARRTMLLRKKFRKRRALLLRRHRRNISRIHQCSLLQIFSRPNQLLPTTSNTKRICMKPRSCHFWQHRIEVYGDKEWLETFRMTPITFKKLCSRLSFRLNPEPLCLKSRNPVSSKKQVAIALYKLANCTENRVIGNLFGVHRSTVRKCFFRVVNAINDVMKDFLIMPNEIECKVISRIFERISHIPQLIGCIGGTHIPVTVSRKEQKDFVNAKGWTSYKIQAVVDDQRRFRNVFIRHPSTTDDADIFEESDLFKDHINLIPQQTKNINGCDIPCMIVGDPSYPLLRWLIKEYTTPVSAEQESFNAYLNSARVAVNEAFTRLKARWRILAKQIDVSHTRENFMESWTDEVTQSDVKFPQPDATHNRTKDSPDGTEIRKHITNFLADNLPFSEVLFEATIDFSP